MALTVISGVICLISMLWLVLHQPSDGKRRKNTFAVIVLVCSFPVMIAGGVMDMFALEPAAQLAQEENYKVVGMEDLSRTDSAVMKF